MADLVFVVLIIAFFALAAVFVRACDAIIGPDEAANVLSGRAPADATSGSDGPGDGAPVRAVGS